MALEKRFGCRFEPERRLRARGFNGNGHMPDGLLHRQEGRPIAIELELSQKAPSRVTAIMDAHAANLDIEEVWYVVVDDRMLQFMRRLGEGYDHVRVSQWKRALPGVSTSTGGSNG
ncbi:hypothetical protein [Bosea thiooxidans]